EQPQSSAHFALGEKAFRWRVNTTPAYASAAAMIASTKYVCIGSPIPQQFTSLIGNEGRRVRQNGHVSDHTGRPAPRVRLTPYHRNCGHTLHRQHKEDHQRYGGQGSPNERTVGPFRVADRRDQRL